MAKIFGSIKKFAEEQIEIAEQGGIEFGMKKAYLEMVRECTFGVLAEISDETDERIGLMHDFGRDFTRDDAFVVVTQMRDVLQLRQRLEKEMSFSFDKIEDIDDTVAFVLNEIFGGSLVNLSDYEETLALLNLPHAINEHVEKYLLGDKEPCEVILDLLTVELGLAHDIELSIDEAFTDASEEGLIDGEFAEVLSKRMAEVAGLTDELLGFDGIAERIPEDDEDEGEEEKYFS